MNKKFKRKKKIETEVTLLSFLINLMHPCWIKVLIYLFLNHTDPELLIDMN